MSASTQTVDASAADEMESRSEREDGVKRWEDEDVRVRVYRCARNGGLVDEA